MAIALWIIILPDALATLLGRSATRLAKHTRVITGFSTLGVKRLTINHAMPT